MSGDPFLFAVDAVFHEAVILSKPDEAQELYKYVGTVNDSTVTHRGFVYGPGSLMCNRIQVARQTINTSTIIGPGESVWEWVADLSFLPLEIDRPFGNAVAVFERKSFDPLPLGAL